MKLRFAERMDGLEEYQLAKTIRSLDNTAGDNVINLAIGNPDIEPPREVINELAKSARAKLSSCYQPSGGNKMFRTKAAGWYKSKFNVELNPAGEIISLIGSKEGIFHISLAMLNKGDKVFVPDPGYPVYSLCAKLLGASAVKYNLKEKNNRQIDINELKRKWDPDIKILWLNSPHMPTGSRLNGSTVNRIIKFAAERNILVVNDNPYSFILNKEKPYSILSDAGTSGNVIEFCSLSKTFNIPGFRIAVAAGNSEILSAIAKTKSIIDSGSYLPLQMGACKAFSLGEEWFESLNSTYSKRKKLVLNMASVLGCSADKESAGMFVWAKLPAGINDVGFAEMLAEKYKILVTPGSVYGTNGKGHLRISLCQPEEKIKSAIKRIKNINRG